MLGGAAALTRGGAPEADVQDADLARVLALPRRATTTESEIDAITRYVAKRPGVRLRGPQAEFCRELWNTGGIFGPMRVGSGKTLASLLAPTIAQAERPVLVVPASLRDKTRRDFAALLPDWHVVLPTLLSYEELGRPDREATLTELRPDLITLDEAHKARNLDAAVTRRLQRIIVNTGAKVVSLSGTLMTDSLMDYHHLGLWSLREHLPAPFTQDAAKEWARVIDKRVALLERRNSWKLGRIPGGFHEWFRGSGGVIPTPGSDCTAKITIDTWTPALPDSLRRTIDQVVETSARPDGEPLDEFDLPDCLCQLALGFYYVWDPMPPSWWLNPRRGWRIYATEVLKAHLDGLDSEGQLAMALDNGRPVPWAEQGRELLAAWRAVRDRFVPNPVPVWIDRAPLAQAVAAAGERCLIWTRYRAAGHALAEMGVPYYGGKTHPEDARGRTIACSIAAHGTGRNLQAWDRNLVLTPMANPDAWEQLIGRTHRAGQLSPVVHVSVIDALQYHRDVMGRVYSRARATSAASGFSQKLLDAVYLGV